MFTDDSSNQSEIPSERTARANPLEMVWHELISGRCKIVASGATDDNYYFELAAVHDPRASALPEHELQLLVSILLGHRQKSYAIDAECAPSTVATHLGHCLETLGLPRRSHRLPLLLFVMAQVVYGALAAHCVRVEERVDDNRKSWRIQSYRPEIGLAQLLSESETAVISDRVQGRSYAEIASARGTSTRTVANQIASVYQKLRVSGRSELLCYIAQRLEVFARPVHV